MGLLNNNISDNKTRRLLVVPFGRPAPGPVVVPCRAGHIQGPQGRTIIKNRLMTAYVANFKVFMRLKNANYNHKRNQQV